MIALERDAQPLRHGTAIILLALTACACGILPPIVLADQLSAGSTQHALGGAVYVGEAPVLVEGQEAVIDAGKDGLGPFLCHLGLAAQFVLGTNGLAAQRGDLKVGAHASEQFARAEWLCQVVVRPRRQAFDLGFLAGPRRQQKHRRIAQLGVLPQRRKETKTVELRHHHIDKMRSGLSCRAAANAISPSVAVSTRKPAVRRSLWT
jgi:hypothetical protein